MNVIKTFIIASFILAFSTGSEQAKKINQKEKAMTIDSTKQYGFNRHFLKKHTTIIELKNAKSAILLVPSWQIQANPYSGDVLNSYRTSCRRVSDGSFL
ncbi:MAG: hypothetical protein ABSF81_14070 [Bacteroidales bacterium]|jgi:hypothetical protein